MADVEPARKKRRQPHKGKRASYQVVEDDLEPALIDKGESGALEGRDVETSDADETLASATGKVDSTAAFAARHKPQKPSARAKAGNGRSWTLSVALPGSILRNAQTPELKAALVGQIGRACAIFGVDEVVVFNEPVTRQPKPRIRGRFRDPEADRAEEAFDPNQFMAGLLEYLECPQYLRKLLFPMDPTLRLAGLLPPLDLPHHLRREDDSPWREGCTVSQKGSFHHAASAPKKRKSGTGSTWADVGLYEPVEVELDEDIEVPEGTRVTIKMPRSDEKYARLVPPREPTEQAGLNWGFAVRYADSISKVLTESPFAATGGYDVAIGTSERGKDVVEVCEEINPFHHMIVVFGGLAGLELTIAGDESLDPRLGADEASLLFDHWVNTLPGQGSRTVRTEEALLVSLQALRATVLMKGIR